MSISPNVIGKNIKKYRKAAKLTQKQLAEKTGKTESSIQKYEAGKVDIPLNVIKQIAKVLSTTIEELCGLVSRETDKETGITHTNIIDDNLLYKVYVEAIIQNASSLNLKGLKELAKRSSEMTCLKEYTDKNTDN